MKIMKRLVAWLRRVSAPRIIYGEAVMAASTIFGCDPSEIIYCDFCCGYHPRMNDE